MKQFVPASSTYTQFTAGYPDTQANSRKTLVDGGRRRLRSFTLVCTKVGAWNNPTFQLRTEEGNFATSTPAGEILFEHQAPRLEHLFGTGEGLVVDSVEMPGKGIVFPSGIHLWTTSDESGGRDQQIPGYTLTIVYT